MTVVNALILIDKDDNALIKINGKYDLNPHLADELRREAEEAIASGANNIYFSMYTAGSLFYIMLEKFTRDVAEALLKEAGKEVNHDSVGILRDVIKFELIAKGYTNLLAKVGNEDGQSSRIEKDIAAARVSYEKAVADFKDKFPGEEALLESLYGINTLRKLREFAITKRVDDMSTYRVSRVLEAVNKVAEEVRAAHPGVTIHQVHSIPDCHVRQTMVTESVIAEYISLENRVLDGAADVEDFVDHSWEVVRHILDSERYSSDPDGSFKTTTFGKKLEQVRFLIERIELLARREGFEGKFEIKFMSFSDDKPVNLEAVKTAVETGDLAAVMNYYPVFCDKSTGVFEVRSDLEVHKVAEAKEEATAETGSATGYGSMFGGSGATAAAETPEVRVARLEAELAEAQAALRAKQAADAPASAPVPGSHFS